jgi:chemotaxis protein methyltransferase CheR
VPVAPDIVQAIARRLAERAGLELPAWVVEARAAARIEALALAPDAYVALIESARGTSELDELVEAVRVGETRLFRHRAQIAALCDDIIPALRASGRRAVRVWSAGCAGGEEPYTLAVVLARLLPNIQIQITATDVSADALATAQTATYRGSALADVPEQWRDDFIVDGDRLRIRPELTALVRFERANLVDGNTPRACDIVWCRNVLIYFTPEARRRAVERLIAATNVGGYIFVGYSESLRDFRILEPIRTGDAVYYVKRDAEPRAAPTPTPALGVPRISATALAASADSGMWKLSAHTPPPTRIPLAPPTEDVLVLRGEPAARQVTAELTARLGIAGLQKLVVDLDAADMLADELAQVFRRARAAAEAAHVALVLRTTRAGTRRWLARHGLEETP